MAAWKKLLCLLLTIHSIKNSFVHSLSPDGKALLDFKQCLKDTTGALSNWKRWDEDPCIWTGVECDSERRVVILNLPHLQLIGKVSPSIGQLDKVRRIGLHSNNFFGTIPAEVANCKELRSLYLRKNMLSGVIPPELARLNNLKIMDLSSNSLTGSIPPSLGNLTNLIFLNVSKNSLSGIIPSHGALDRFSNSSFLENFGLCGSQVNQTCIFPAPGPTPQNQFVHTDSRKGKKYSNGLLLSALGTIGASLSVTFSCFWAFLLYHRVRGNPCRRQTNAQRDSKLILFHGDMPFSAADVLKKIEMLDSSDIIGSGGFGTVYKLVMDEKSIFAVKKIGKSGSVSNRLFERELEVLGSIKHKNLVNLRGYCTSSSAKLLIYDYLPCGSLDQILHDSRNQEALLSWPARLKIAIETARGLSYLHHECNPRIIHRDIKSSNILLDMNLEPRVSDFGLAKLLEENESHVTTIVAGTFGYLAPEYTQHGRATEKSDVYSYGVVLLELLSGRRPTDPCFVEKGLNIVGWATRLISERKYAEILDSKCCLFAQSMEPVLQVAAMCISANADDRPNMATVVKMLQAESLTSDFYDSFSD